MHRLRELALADYLTIKDAAALLGVTPETLRNWDRADKLKPIRHPINGYRLYAVADLRTLLERAFKSKRGRPRSNKEGPA